MSRAEDIFQKLIYFGEDAIDDFIVNLQTEELFLDFKQAVSTGKTAPACIKTTEKSGQGHFGFRQFGRRRHRLGRRMQPRLRHRRRCQGKS